MLTALRSHNRRCSSQSLIGLLQRVADGQLSPEEAASRVNRTQIESVGSFAFLDQQRAARTGFAEVVFGQGKTADQVAKIMSSLSEQHETVMATRVDPEKAALIAEALPAMKYFTDARICALGADATPSTHIEGSVAVLAAGTADLPVAEECAVTLELNQVRKVERLYDVGVAGLHRLFRHYELVRQADVVIVVAGMDGALPGVVGGLVSVPVIAVPTSIGYGASFEGLAALLSMLNSCATGVSVVNIDNGFGAAMSASQILRTAARLKSKGGDELSA